MQIRLHLVRESVSPLERKEEYHVRKTIYLCLSALRQENI